MSIFNAPVKGISNPKKPALVDPGGPSRSMRGTLSSRSPQSRTRTLKNKAKDSLIRRIATVKKITDRKDY